MALGLLVLAALPSSSQARDMHGRLGAGYNGQFATGAISTGIPALSVKYGVSRDIALEAVIGFNTATGGNSVFAGKFFKNVLFENNLNFYFMAGGGGATVTGVSGIEFLAGLGAEFFVPGLESLGFSMEFGAALGTLSGSFAVRSMGVNFLNAGMHFYF